MGNVKVQYKQRRGGDEAGAEIDDAQAFFAEILNTQFNNTKAMYEGLDDEMKQAFLDIFNGDLNMTNET